MLYFINVDHTRSLWLMLDLTVDTLKDVKPYTTPARLLLSTVKRMLIFSHVLYLDNKESKIVCLLTWPKHQLKECLLFCLSSSMKWTLWYSRQIVRHFIWTLIPKISTATRLQSQPMIFICILHSSGNQLNNNEEGKNFHIRLIYILKSVEINFNYNFTNK